MVCNTTAVIFDVRESLKNDLLQGTGNLFAIFAAFHSLPSLIQNWSIWRFMNVIIYEKYLQFLSLALNKRISTAGCNFTNFHNQFFSGKLWPEKTFGKPVDPKAPPSVGLFFIHCLPNRGTHLFFNNVFEWVSLPTRKNIKIQKEQTAQRVRLYSLCSTIDWLIEALMEVPPDFRSTQYRDQSEKLELKKGVRKLVT